MVTKLWSAAVLPLLVSSLGAQHPGASQAPDTTQDAASATQDAARPSRSGRPRRGGFRPSRTVVRAADADVNGEVSAAEWEALLAVLDPDGDGTIDPGEFRARCFVPMLDQDKDGQLTIDDLLFLFESLDKNLDYVIVASEIPAGGFSTAGRTPANPTGAGANLYMAPVPFLAADADRSGDVDADEWGLFLDELELNDDETIASSTLVRWMDAEQALEEKASQPMSTTSILRWVDGELDADDDGRVTVDDAQVFFDALDGDGNGVIAKDELTFSMRGRGPTAAERARPPLMPWQRTLEDALALSEATGKPLLICVNMDGETASESLALRRYRDPAFVELAQGFVPVLASPDRRNPRDHDDRGRRILDGKFGRVVASEHIDIEPILYERYFEGQRVSPRHLAVDLDGNVLFDIYLVNDLTLVDEALREHGVRGPQPADPAGLREDELLASPDALHRAFLETRFLEGDERTRARLASLALSSVRETQHPELLRLALFDPAESVRREGVWTAARNGERTPFEFFAAAFRIADGQPELRLALLAGLERTAASAPDRAQRRRALLLHDAFAGVRGASDSVDVDRWKLALGWAAAPSKDVSIPKDTLDRRLLALEKRMSAAADPELDLAFAAAAMSYARLQIRDGRDPRFLLEDVIAAAKRAVLDGDELPDGRAFAYQAWGSYLLGDMEPAGEFAERAAQYMVPWAGSALAAKSLEILAGTRTRAVYAAMGEDVRWPTAATGWITDVCAAYDVLLEHPYGTEDHAVQYVDFLNAIGVSGDQEAVLRIALARFPTSGRLNARFRAQLLRDAGAEVLARAYTELTTDAEIATTLAWYDGLAQLVVAERHVQNRDRASALAAYRASVERFRSSTASREDYAESAGHYICLALSGAARVHMEGEDLPEAIRALREAVAANPESVWETDGLGNTPRDTAGKLYRSLLDGGKDEEARSLFEFLEEKGLKLQV